MNILLNLGSVEARVLRNAVRHEWDVLQAMKTAYGVKISTERDEEERARLEASWNRYDEQQKAANMLLKALGE